MFPRVSTVLWFVTTIVLVISSFALLVILHRITPQTHSENIVQIQGPNLPKNPNAVNLSENLEGSLPLSPESLRHFSQRGTYMVLADFIVGSLPVVQTFDVTFVTQCTVDYLDNVRELVEFWKGFISVAIYAPGTEFKQCVNKIAKLRSCPGRNGEEITKRVSFHIFFDEEHYPKTISEGLLNLVLPKVNKRSCRIENDPKVIRRKGPKIASTKRPQKQAKNYRTNHQLLYPINMARNIAREHSRTYFVFVCDIELYPNPANLIPLFLSLVTEMAENDLNFETRRQVFVLPPFELFESVTKPEIPKSKTALVKMLKDGVAIPFHAQACRKCHKIPNETEWIETADNGKLGIFGTTPYFGIKAWEPFYIGTHADPPWDERIFREFSLNKPVQISALCNLDYKFHILDNAFVAHKPGIRRGKGFWNYSGKAKVLEFAKKYVIPLQIALYGKNARCSF